MRHFPNHYNNVCSTNMRSSPVIVKAVQGRRSIKVKRLCWKGKFEPGVMDDQSGDDDIS